MIDIQNFIEEFKKTFIYDILCESLEDEQLFEHTIVGNQVIWMKEQTRQMWFMWQQAQKAAVPNPKNEVICAIEREVENQLIASGIEADPFRLDGEKIFNAMIEAGAKE